MKTLRTKVRQLLFGLTEKEKFKKEKTRIRSNYSRTSLGYATLFGKKFLFNDNISFLDTYREIFENEIYNFKVEDNNNEKIILDCGANIGLSILYFHINYPQHKIIAFEPDPIIFEILEKNAETFGIKNLELYKKAIWTEETKLPFFSDGAMAGTLLHTKEINKITVETVRLKDFLNSNIVFLKMDIEGSEVEVIKDCYDDLKKLRNVFVEYHSYINKPQELDYILEAFKANGFRSYIQESFVSKRPFREISIICDNMDMAVNIFSIK